MPDFDSPGELFTRYFQDNHGDIRYIFSPFIQSNTLESYLPEATIDTIIVTRWRTTDLVSGVSDPYVFEYCKENGYTLKINPRLHAKVYSWDLDRALIGSANITNQGFRSGQDSNIEILHGPVLLNNSTQLLLREAEQNANLVTQQDFNNVIEFLDETDIDEPEIEEIELGRDPMFLVSHLPMTEEPSLVISVLARDRSMSFNDLSNEGKRCVMHDIATFSLGEYRGESASEIESQLRDSFVSHEFINRIISEMDPCIFFGEMKDIVHNECEDVPTPSKRELTDNIQVLYNWFPKINPDRFEHDVPGRHSERLCDKSKKIQ